MRARMRNLPGPRLTCWGRRVHHGRFGWWLLLAGAFLMWHDRADFPWAFHDTPREGERLS